MATEAIFDWGEMAHWVCIEDVGADKQVSWSSVVPTEFDKVITVNTGIKAGSPIGYLGLHEVLSGPSGGKNSKYQVHLEVFTADANIEDFLNNAAGLTQGKQYLSLSSGATLSPKPPATVGSTLVDAHALELANAPVFKDSASVEWYEVSVKDNGEAKTGLVKKQDAILITQHDWKKLGFTVVQENDKNADGFLDPENMPQFFQDIYKKIDSNQDGDVDPGELTEALKDEETRSHWSKLVAYHPTEWKDKSSAPKWSRLNTLLETTPKVLLHEQERIDRTVFWDELGAAAPVSSGLIWHFHSVAFIENFLSSTCIPLDKAKEIALLVSSGYEGHDKLDYEALAGNFDGQGMSFGVIQWNFGQGTLGPVLLEMRSKDQAAFDGCFGANMNFQTLLNSLSNADKTAQMNWAIGIMSSNNVGWKAAFKKIGQNEDFQKIQLAHAAKYNDNVISCIKLMREVAPNLMVKVRLRTYCALYDLCVQQNNLKKAEDLIHEEFSSANITTQKDLLICVCKKRAETASTAYRADAFSRRMGIILGQKYTATLSGVTASRENGNYSNIVEGDVCEL